MFDRTSRIRRRGAAVVAVLVTLAEEGIETLFGTQDENLRRIEKAFLVSVSARGSEVRVGGEDVERTLNHPDWKNRTRPEEGVKVLDLTRDLDTEPEGRVL